MPISSTTSKTILMTPISTKKIKEESFQEILQKVSGVIKKSMQGAQEVGKSATIDNGLGMHTMSDSTQRKGIAAVQGSQTKVPTFRTSFFLF
ncbi:hypothetical protein ES288_D02G151900v1 [Gossypium darwinii]|uniref:Uncharacterized protein n=1 Tax=Gossypium darwinii TaxID=34276 RepID=A0A5D2DD90_GOSDA|nr:hypothetical protein ES288_D02G151900v1 [Gossypium darwinii]